MSKRGVNIDHSSVHRWVVRFPHQLLESFQQRLFPTCYGSEFISRDPDLWAYVNNVTLDFSRPGKPTDNAYIESFNGKFRAECLNQHWFLTLDDARQKMEEWRRDYNEVRPHSAIGNKPPISLMNASGASGPP